MSYPAPNTLPGAYVPPDLTGNDNAGTLPDEQQAERDELEAAYHAQVEASAAYEEEIANLPPPEPPAAPTLGSLSPATAVVGGPDLVLSCIGTGFVPGAVIVWNGADEPTTFVDETEVTTVVKPSTASGPWSIPVLVRNPDGQVTAELQFTFTEEAPA